MDFKSVLSYLGVILEILGVLSLIPIVISGIYGDNLHTVFFITGVFSFALGTILDKKFEKDRLTLGSAMIISALSFIAISFIGAIPYFYFLSPVDAVFESVSGFTTTGLTVVNPESLPYTLLFWRSFTQWIGGVGILVIFILLVGSPGISSYYLYRAEGREERIEAGVKHTVKKLFIIYSSYTIAGIVLLFLAGMPLFDSLLHAFTSLSTGGFSPKNSSIGYYANPWIETVIIFLMILGATSFFIHHKLWGGGIKRKSGIRERIAVYVKNPETKLFWSIIFIFSLLLTYTFLSMNAPARHGVFQTVSALTTTGYTTLGTNPADATKFLIIVLMIIGGYAGSTSGGLKLVRFGIIGKSVSWIGKKISLPSEAIVPFKFGKRIVKDNELTIISLFACVYVLILIVSGVIISLMGYTPIDALYQASSAQGTVGLSSVPVASMPVAAKVILMVNMLIGRLELIPFLVLIYALYKIRLNG